MRTPLPVRFEKFISPEPNTGCWLWTGALTAWGYGKVSAGGDFGETLMAHRVAFERTRGSIPRGMFVCHRCDMPSCVNPEHLVLGTAADNSADMIRKGRHHGPKRPPKGDRNGRARLSIANVLAIRASTEPHATLARLFGVSSTTVRHIRSGRLWAHVSQHQPEALEGARNGKTADP
jgi:hypothetical protein